MSKILFTLVLFAFIWFQIGFVLGFELRGIKNE